LRVYIEKVFIPRDVQESSIQTRGGKEQLASQVKTDDLGWTFQPAFYASLYDELSKAK